jgi:WD40 repeat protein
MRLLTGYQKPILALAFTPDGAGLYSTAKGQQMIWLWDVTSATVARKLPRQGNRYGITVLAVSPDGHLLSGSPLADAMVWPPGQTEPRTLDDEIQLSYPRAALALSPGGRLIAGACSSRHDHVKVVRLWPASGGKHVASLTAGTDGLSALAFASDSGPLAGAAGREVRLWDPRTNDAPRVLKYKSVVNALAFRPDGQALAACAGKSVVVWDARQESMATFTDHSANVTTIAYSPDGKYLASADKDGIVLLRDATSNQIVGQLQLEVGAIGALAWRPDSAGFAAGGEKYVALCDVAELLAQPAAKAKPRGEPLSLVGHTTHVDVLAYSPDGKTLASAERHEVRLWDLSGGAGQARPKGAFVPGGYPSVTALSWSPDSRRLVLCSPTQVHDGATGAMLHSPEGGHLACLPSGRLFLIAALEELLSGVRVCLLDETGKSELASATVTVPQRKEDYHYHTGAGPDGRNCYFSYSQHVVVRWDTVAGATDPLFTQDTRVEGLRVSADERLLVTWGGNRAMVWSLTSGKKHLDLKHPLQASGAVFLPNGRLLTSCYDGLVRIWDLSGGTELQALDLEMGKIYSLAVSPGHMTFAAGVQKKWRIVLMDVPE